MTDRPKRFYDFGPFRLDPKERLLLRDGQPVPLPPKIFDTLLVLVENSGQLVEKDELLQKLWPDATVEEHGLSQNIFLLRKALNENTSEPQFIETVPKRGYRFIAELKEPERDGADVVVHKPIPGRIVTLEQTDTKETATETISEKPVKPSLRTLGRVRFRQGVVLVVLFGLAAMAIWLFLPSRRHSQVETGLGIGSIAVLPFKSIGSNDDYEQLSLGIADVLTTRLGGIGEIIVRPASAVRKYNTVDQDPLEAGRELRVDSVLEGSIQKVGDRTRVTVRLLSVQDGRQLWTDKLDEKLVNIFDLQDSISARVVDALAPNLTGEQRKLLTRRYTENTDAYQAFLKGRFYWNKRTEEGMKKAIEYFEQAIELDPNYALAYSGLSDSYVLLGTYVVRSPLQAMPKAEAAALKALDIDDDLAEAHTSLAYVRFRYDWRWDDAEKEFKRAIEMNPNYTTAHHWYGDFLSAMGRFDEAIAEMTIARKLDPLSLMISTDLGGVLAIAGKSDEAIDLYQQTLEMDPHFVPAHRYLGQAYERKGMYREATREFLESLTSSPDDPDGLTMLGHAYASAGKKKEAQRILDRLSDISKRHYVAPYDIAPIYAALGDIDQAFVWLQRAYDERCEGLTLLKIDSTLDTLRSDPRFVELLRRVGIPT